MKKILYLLLLSALLGACQKQTEDEAVVYREMQVSEDIHFESREDLKLKGRVAGAQAHAAGNVAVSASTITDAAVNQESEATDKKKIIRDGHMTIKVKSAQAAKIRVDSLLIPFGAYYASENFNNNDREATFYLRLRIPTAAFDNFMACLEQGYGEILNKDIQARDVTDQFIDLETRLQNKRNYLGRYNSLLKEAKTVKDILQIQEEIRGLEEEIESTTGRLKYLSDQVDYSTLQLNLTEQKDFQFKPEERDRFGEKLKQALTKGWYGLVDFVIFLFKIWPLWLLLSVALIFLKRRSRPTKKEKTKKE